LCDVGRVVVKLFLKLLCFLHLYYNFLTVLIAKVGMLNRIIFISGLNATVIVVFSDRDCL